MGDGKRMKTKTKTKLENKRMNLPLHPMVRDWMRWLKII